MLDAIADVRERMEADTEQGISSELYFYYAGHGELVDGEGSSTLSDGKLTRTEFRSLVLRDSPATITHVIIDACKSYFLVAGRGAGGAREAHAGDFAFPDVTTGVGYILSTSDDADSHEWAAISGGIFSYEVRSAMVGAADADGNGAVDYDEVAAFVAVANEPVPYPRFRPSFFVQAPSDRRSAALFEAARIADAGVLELGEAVHGRVTVTDERGLRYADAHKSAGSVIRLVLIPPRRYEARWGGLTYPVGPAVARVRLAELTGGPELVAARSEVHQAFEGIFGLPFGPELVRGFKLSRATLDPRLEPPPRPRSAWVPALVATGVVSMGAGVGLTLGAADTRVAALGAAQAERPGLDDRAVALEVGAAVAVSTAVLVIAGALVAYYLEE